jgi:hypothetical protein
MPNDLYKAVLFNNGEGADVQDFNNIRGFMGARLFDQVLRAAAASPRGGVSELPTQRTAIATAPFLYALTGGAGYIVPGGAALQTTVRAGTIFQQVGSPAGDEATFLPFTMADAAFTLTHAVGDATNPRIDVIEVKLEYVNGDSESRIVEDPPPSGLQSVQTINKKRRVQATFQIVAGTPGATPAYPSLTAGFAALGAVLVPATHNAVFVAQTHYSDLRIPLGVKPARVRAGDFVVEQPPDDDWTIASDGAATDAMRRAAVLSSLGPTSLYVPSPLASNQRLVGISISGRLQYSALAARLLRVDATDGATADVVLGDLASFLPSSATPTVNHVSMAEIETAIATTAGNAKNAAGLGHGAWGNGQRSGCAAEGVTVDQTTLALELEVTTGGADLTIVGEVVFYFADGLI